MKPNAWLELRRFVAESIASSEFSRLDEISLRLLEWVMNESRASSEPLFMQSLVMRANVASPATVYKCVSKLIDTRMIDVTVDPADTRRRIVRPTPAALKLVDKLSKSTEHWMKTRDT
ncbi:MAG: hypothetical protein FGM18_06565 [Burkholderiaceae bacterium]|nr:hypothetical protein [Burkholderiaceae bacterium]